MRKLLYPLFILLIILYSSPNLVFATKSAFEINQHWHYAIISSSNVIVSQEISLTNNFTGVAPKEFKLEANQIHIQNLQAHDSKGSLPITTATVSGKTVLTTTILRPNLGLNQTTTWRQSFESNDFLTREGAVISFHLPTITSTDTENLTISLSFPPDFPKPFLIQPFSPNLLWNKKSLPEKGILVQFLDKNSPSQTFEISADFWQIDDKIYLPPERNSQKIRIGKVNPLPSDVEISDQNNWEARYPRKIDPIAVNFSVSLLPIKTSVGKSTLEIKENLSCSQTIENAAKSISSFPTRYVSGIYLGSNNKNISHCWLEYQTNESWLPWDPFLETANPGYDYHQQWDLSHVVVFTTNNINLLKTVDIRDISVKILPSGLDSPKDILAVKFTPAIWPLWPPGGKITFLNTGTSLWSGREISFKSVNNTIQTTTFQAKSIPPYGKDSFSINFTIKKLFSNDIITLYFSGSDLYTVNIPWYQTNKGLFILIFVCGFIAIVLSVFTKIARRL